MADKLSIPDAVALVLKRIRGAGVTGERLVRVDFDFDPSSVVPTTIQRMLNEKGYIAYLVIPGGDAEDPQTLVIDMARRRAEVAK